MENRQVKRENVKIISALIILMLILSCLFSIVTPNFVNAETDTYSNVLEDLYKSEDFKKEDFPYISYDYSLQVIQVAETLDDELLIYVYQPSADDENIIASSINIATESNANLNFKNYKLKLLDFNDVFYKYVVEDFVVMGSNIRYYEISSIYRPYNKIIDEEIDKVNDNEIDEVAYEIAKAYTFVGTGEELVVTCQDVDTIKVTSKYVGHIRYSNGFNLYQDSCDSHYIAFSTDRNIDKLMEADVYYVYKSFETPYYMGIEKNTTYGEPQDGYAYLTYTDVASNPGDALFGHTYTWDRISTISNFKSDLINDGISITDEVDLSLENKEWVLRFLETDYTRTISSVGFWNFAYGTRVSEVTILRLKFETEGKVYNLGVVDNKQTGSLSPDNEIGDLLKNFLYTILVLLVVVVAICLLFPEFFRLLMKGIGYGFKYLFQGIWYLISAPFSIFD